MCRLVIMGTTVIVEPIRRETPKGAICSLTSLQAMNWGLNGNLLRLDLANPRKLLTSFFNKPPKLPSGQGEFADEPDQTKERCLKIAGMQQIIATRFTTKT
jgi:hypothetical protein